MQRILNIILIACAPVAMADPSTIASGKSYAWSASDGWIEFIPNLPSTGDGVVIVDRYVTGYAWCAKTGWIHFGDGSPADGVSYANTTVNDRGVNHDGAGKLSGLAWSSKTGWISFDWWAGNSADSNRPSIDLVTGDFSGYAWSANSGWIHLGTGALKTNSIHIVDSDNDNISDTWETEKAGNLVALGTTANADSDGDGTSDVDEYSADTNPLDSNDYLRVTRFVKGENSIDITWISSPSRLYIIRQSGSLSVWSTGSPLAPDAGSNTTRTVEHPAGNQRFFRVDSVLPLGP